MSLNHHLRAGAGTAVIEIGEGILPIEGFTVVRNPLHARVLIMDSSIRTVIASVEVTSLFDYIQEAMTQTLCEMTGAERENIWLTTTHSFGGPHLFPPPKPGEKPKGGRVRTEQDILHCARLADAYHDALKKAASIAMDTMRNAVIGAGTGISTVAASRNMECREGWWLGTDAEEPCNQTVTVLRVDDTAGEPIAMLFNYGVRSCTMQHSRAEDGGGIITSDLCGVASLALEEAIGNNFSAIFLCGAAADQEPQLKSRQTEMDKNGDPQNIDFASVAGALLDAQAARFTAEVLKVWRRTTQLQDVKEIRSGSRQYVCPTKKMAQTASHVKPTREASFEPDGEKILTVYALRLGVMNLIGVQPEIDSVTSLELAQAVPGEITAAAICVNGGEKCMPERTAYEQVKYQSLNSPFQAGCAERMRDTAIELLNNL